MKKIFGKKQLHKSQKGFSLIEVIIALAILAIISVPICHSFVTAAKTNAKARKQASANAVAENVMEGINAYSYEDIFTEFTVTPNEDFLISENCLDKGVLSGWADASETTPGNTMVYQIQGVSEDVYRFDVRITVDASAYLAASEEDEEGFNDQALTVITNYNSEKDYLFAQAKEDEIAAYQILASRSSGHTYAEFEGKVRRTIHIVIEKEEDPDVVYVSNAITYEYVGSEGWLSGADAVYTRYYGAIPYSSEELLRNVYLCYFPNYASGLTNMDEIMIDNLDNVEATFFVIKQLDDTGSALEAKENQYVPIITVNEGKWEEGQTGAYTSFHTNLGINLATNEPISGVGGPSYSYYFQDSDNTNRFAVGTTAETFLHVEGAVETQKLNRMYQVSVEVYESGAYGNFAGGTRVAHLTSD